MAQEGHLGLIKKKNKKKPEIGDRTAVFSYAVQICE